MRESNSSNPKPSITVVIANYNNGAWMGKAIESVKEQGVDNVRVAILDNGSTDNSWQAIEEAAGYEKQRIDSLAEGITDAICNHWLFAYRTDTPLGPSKSRNILIREFLDKADIFAILDADDYWLPGKLSKSILKLLESPYNGVVYTDNYLLNTNNNQTTREFRESFNLERLFQNCYIHSGSVIKADVFKKVGLYREDMRTAEDWDLWLRAARYFNIVHIPEPLVVARIHNQNSTNSVDPKVWQENWAKIAQTIQNVYQSHQ